jgi:hypothetical protein
MKTLTEAEIWVAHRRASHDVSAWRAAGAVLAGLSTGLVAAWLWSIVEIWETFF